VKHIRHPPFRLGPSPTPESLHVWCDWWEDQGRDTVLLRAMIMGGRKPFFMKRAYVREVRDGYNMPGWVWRNSNFSAHERRARVTPQG
jgi:hypothetical protein